MVFNLVMLYTPVGTGLEVLDILFFLSFSFSSFFFFFFKEGGKELKKKFFC